MLCLCAVLSGANSISEISWYGRLYRALLVERLGLGFEQHTPSHDTLGRVLSLLDGAALVGVLEAWMASLHQVTAGEVVALDGKTVRGSFDTASGQKALHLVSAFACEAKVVLGLEEATSVGAEVEAMHALLCRLELSGRTVTLDAAGTRPDVAQTIRERGGHYLLALKANHRHLHEDVAALFQWHQQQMGKVGLAQVGLEWQEVRHSGGGHGRFESRRVVAVCAAKAQEFLASSLSPWPGVQTLVMVERTRKKRVRGQETRSVERAFFLCSLPAKTTQDARTIGAAIRSHWAIENSLHWGLDVVWDEDASRVRKDNAPKNLALLKRMVTNIMQQDASFPISIKLKRKTAAWNPEFLLLEPRVPPLKTCRAKSGSNPNAIALGIELKRTRFMGIAAKVARIKCRSHRQRTRKKEENVSSFPLFKLAEVLTGQNHMVNLLLGTRTTV